MRLDRPAPLPPTRQPIGRRILVVDLGHPIPPLQDVERPDVECPALELRGVESLSRADRLKTIPGFLDAGPHRRRNDPRQLGEAATPRDSAHSRSRAPVRTTLTIRLPRQTPSALRRLMRPPIRST